MQIEVIARAIVEVCRFLPSLGQSDSVTKNSKSTVIFYKLPFIVLIFIIFIFLSDSCGFKSCSIARVLLRQILSIVICGSLECCGLASKYVLNINIYTLK